MKDRTTDVERIEPWNWKVINVGGKRVLEPRYRAENGFGGMNIETATCGECDAKLFPRAG